MKAILLLLPRKSGICTYTFMSSTVPFCPCTKSTLLQLLDFIFRLLVLRPISLKYLNYVFLFYVFELKLLKLSFFS